MKQFMVVAEVEGLTMANFADTYTEAKNKAMDIECGLGGYAEIYAREQFEGGFEYRLIEA